VDHLRPVSLVDLDGAAALLDRIDRKYVVAGPLAAQMLAECRGRLSALEIDRRRSFVYESYYFDTPELDSYRGAAFKRRRRFKVRTRTYTDSEMSLLEIKTRDGRGRTVKRRRPIDHSDRYRIPAEMRPFVDQTTGIDGLGARLVEILGSRYSRTTLLDSADGARITLDAGLVCFARAGRAVGLGDQVVLETKSERAATAADRWLWSNGVRPTKISKFATGLAALHPELPSNKWHRTLQRHFPTRG
jgi:hypothetical protein